MTRDAIIVGGGIGGLGAALALARRGVEVRLLERAEAFAEVGAGIQQGPNAVRVHRVLGTEDPLRAVAFAPEAATIRDGITGRVLVRTPLGRQCEARYGAPYLAVHRADLHGVLLAAAREAGVQVETGTPVGACDHGPPARVPTPAGALQADLLVGADGARSAVRSALFGDAPPRFTGAVAWRLLLRQTDHDLPSEAVSWIGPGGHVVTYPLGHDRLNVVAVREGQAWTAEGWSRPADPADLAAAFAGWDARLTGLFAAAGACDAWGLFDRPPLRRWSVGAAALLGDAAHPMLPYLAQGASMAIEDAWVLADEVGGAGALADALTRYEARRRPRTTWVARASRANAGLFHRRAGLSGLAGRAKLAAGHAVPALPRHVMDRLWGFDATRGAKGRGTC